VEYNNTVFNHLTGADSGESEGSPSGESVGDGGAG